MKIQLSNKPKNVNIKKRASINSGFDALFKLQTDSLDTVQEDLYINEKQQPAEDNEHLEKALQDLEGIMISLEKNSVSYQRAQRAIDSLRDVLSEIPNAFPISQHDRQEAEALLIVESKRLEELAKYDS